MSTGSEPEIRNVAAQGSVVAGMTLLSRISGFARDVLLSNFLGASFVADAFFVAFRIPNFFRRLFAEGAFNQAFVPVLSSFKTDSRLALLEFVSVMSGNLGAVLLLAVLIGVVGSPGLVAVFAPGFWQDPERFDLTSDMVRITFGYLGFVSLTAFCGALLNAHHRYALPAFTPVLLNISLIAAILFASSWFSTPVFALAWGILFAGLAQLLLQIPALSRLGLIVAPRVDFRHEGARKVGGLLVPAVFAASVGQINALIDTMLASTLVTGSISWLYYSDRLFELPIGLVAVALGTVLLPNLSRLASEDDLNGFQATIDWGVRVGVVLGVPAAVALYVMALPLISSIFMHGALTEFDATMAALSLEAFSAGLVPLVLVKVLAPAFFADQDTKTPFRIGVVAVVVNIVLNLLLFRVMGHVGLALATACAAWVNAMLLWRRLNSNNRYKVTRLTLLSMLRCLAASVVMAAALTLLLPEPGMWIDAGIAERTLWLVSGVCGGALLYVGLLFVTGLRVEHLLHRV